MKPYEKVCMLMRFQFKDRRISLLMIKFELKKRRKNFKIFSQSKLVNNSTSSRSFTAGNKNKVPEIQKRLGTLIPSQSIKKG